MSWSLFLNRTKMNTEPYGEEKDEDVIPFTKSEILYCITDISKTMNISIEDTENHIMYVYGQEWSINMWFWKKCLYSENSYYVVELEIKAASERKEFLSLLAKKLNARLFDMYADTFWTVDGTGFADWKSFCYRIAKELSDTKGNVYEHN
ncbi:MAG: hypothetical protein NC205_06960 [Prevotella sp.]|nr:hypothetical protein [Alistipes senegalensis]MCM1358318.1 hypothetical protein [Prevotella sp.]